MAVGKEEREERKEEGKVFLPLYIDYEMNRKKGEPEVVLLGKTQEGEKVKAVVTGFLPYFYLEVPESINEVEMQKWAHTVRSAHADIVQQKTLRKQNIYGYAKEISLFVQIFYKDPKETETIRKAVDKCFFDAFQMRPSFFEANIGFITRFMVDRDIVGMGYVRVQGKTKEARERETGENKEDQTLLIRAHYEDVRGENEIKKLPPLKILSFDLECIGREGKFPSAKIDSVVQIGNTIAQYPSPEPVARVLFCVRDTDAISNVTIKSYATEEEMLLAWSQWISEADPDVLTGYNVCRFDFAYLLERAEVLGIASFRQFARTEKHVTIRAVTSVTAAFGTVENKIVTIPGRLVFDVLDIVRREFKLHNYSLNTVSSVFLNEEKEDVHYTEITSLFNGTSETRRRLGSYCMKDTYLPLRIIFAKNLFVNYCELARVTGVPFEYLVNRGQGIRVLSQLLRRAKEHSYLLPMVTSKEETYEGGYVMEPEKGFYRDPVAVLDFASLYPSIIMAYNLCYTTLLEKGKEKGLAEGEDYTVSPTGDCFVTPKHREGLLPQILLNLLNSRKQAKQDLAREKDAEMRMALDAKQLALKISANSVYGFTGAAKTGLPCIPISRSVTAFGREILKTTKTLIEEEYRQTQQLPLRVIYGDTDSVMITAPGIALEEAFAAGEAISTFVTKALPNPLTLAFEKVYFPFLLMNKKRYAGSARASLASAGKIDIKGIEIVRREKDLSFFFSFLSFLLPYCHKN